MLAVSRGAREYKLRNGYSIAKTECYDGYTMQYQWSVFAPGGQLYMSCGSYQEAYKLASHLVEEAN